MAGKESVQDRLQLELKDLAKSIFDLVDKFKSLHNPLTESQEKVPIATEQLDKISEQTEAAAHQMLDRIDNITERETTIVNELTEIKKAIAAGTYDGLEPRIDDMITKANANCDDAFMIMDALQFQDITSQQMSHAASLLEDIENKLNQIVGVMEGQVESVSKAAGDTAEAARKDRAYDPHADLFDKKTDQATIDDLFAKKNER